MKFPKELSKERLSLLSPEDRKIYEWEHPKQKKIHTIFEDIDAAYAQMSHDDALFFMNLTKTLSSRKRCSESTMTFSLIL